MNTRSAAKRGRGGGNKSGHGAGPKSKIPASSAVGRKKRDKTATPSSNKITDSNGAPVVPKLPPHPDILPIEDATFGSCSYSFFGGSGICERPAEMRIHCSFPWCFRLLHLPCQRQWEVTSGCNEPPELHLCYRHHPHYTKLYGIPPPLNPAEHLARMELSETTGSSCDWVEQNKDKCCHPELVPEKCGHDGCDKRVHHLCQLQWEEANGVELDGLKKRCMEHHPNYNTSVAACDGKLPAAGGFGTSFSRQPTVVQGVTQRARKILTNATNQLMGNLTNYVAGASPHFGSSPANSTLTGSARTMNTNLELFDDNIDNGRSNDDKVVHPSVPLLSPRIARLNDLERIPYVDQDQELDELFWEDMVEYGDGGDSDQEGSVSMLHDSAVNSRIVLASSGKCVGDDDDDIDDEGIPSDPLPARDDALSTTTDQSTCGSVISNLLGAPQKWLPPCPPPTWISYTQNDKKYDAPDEDKIDNPGAWSYFSFRPRYNDKERKYIGHFSPAGAQVVPMNISIQQRVVDGWSFHYNGWTPNDLEKSTFVRGEATRQNIRPLSRNGMLDVDVLKKHGLNTERVRSDPLFFFQMLFPLSHTSTTVEGDNRIPFFTLVTWYTHIYAASNGASLGFGHKWVPPDVSEMVKWTAIPIRHGSLDGQPGTLNSRWKRTDPRYDSVIADTMGYARFRQIKRYFKLNNNSTERPKGSPEYDPCNKYDFIFKVLCHNMNYCTNAADLDLAVDESTWGFSGYCGEAGWRLMNKPVGKGACYKSIYLFSLSLFSSQPDSIVVIIIVAIIVIVIVIVILPSSSFRHHHCLHNLAIVIIKGGQTTMLYDVSRRYPRHYVHRHKLTDKRRPPGFTQEGPSEIHHMVNVILTYIKGNDVNPTEFVETIAHPGGKIVHYKRKQVFSNAPHIVADNYFSGEHVLDYVGKHGLGFTSTIRRDRIPKLLKPYVHHEKVNAMDLRCKVMRFQNPIFAVKNVLPTQTTKAYTKTLVSFQSTGPTNITGVNNLPSCQLYVSKKDRGRKDDKLVWGIEQNEGRETYLRHYFGIDIADHLIKNANIKFLSWKFWHAPYLHALSMGVLAAYDMYQECCDGALDPDWKIDKKRRMSFSVFRQTLSLQMLEYDPTKLRYLGDHSHRVVTQTNNRKRKAGTILGEREQRNRDEENYYEESGLTCANFRKAMMLPRLNHGGNVSKLQEHLVSIWRTTNKMTCEVCGRATNWKCGVCKKPMCTTDGKRLWNGAVCAMTFHNPGFWGLARSDVHLHNMKVSEWQPPTKQMIKRNENMVAALAVEIEMGDIVGVV